MSYNFIYTYIHMRAYVRCNNTRHGGRKGVGSRTEGIPRADDTKSGTEPRRSEHTAKRPPPHVPAPAYRGPTPRPRFPPAAVPSCQR